MSTDVHDEIRPLEDWYTLQHVAALFGYTKQGISNRVFHPTNPLFDRERDVRTVAYERRRFYLVRRTAVEEALIRHQRVLADLAES